MKNLFRKVRVVHKPEQCRYEVEYKVGLFSSWTYQCGYKYVVTGKPSLNYHEHTQENAKELAIQRAKVMSEQTVEWEN